MNLEARAHIHSSRAQTLDAPAPDGCLRLLHYTNNGGGGGLPRWRAHGHRTFSPRRAGRAAQGRGLHSSTFQLNLSALYGIG